MIIPCYRPWQRPEYSFRPSELFASDIGSDVDSHETIEHSQPGVLSDITQIEHNLPAPPETSAFQQDNSLSPTTVPIENLSLSPPSTNTFSAKGEGFPPREVRGEIKKLRRQLWDETGYVPPIAGGSPRRRIELPIDEIVDLYTESGLTLSEIATRYSVSDETIRNRLHKAKVEVRPAVHEASQRIDLPVDQIVELYLNQKSTIAEIAEHFGVSFSTIRERLLEQEIELRHKGRLLKPLPIEDLRNLYEEQGKSAAEIAHEYHCHLTTVLDALRKAGINIRKHGPRLELSLDSIVDMYTHQGFTMAEIAEQLGVGKETIRRRLHEAGIETSNL